MTTSIKITEQQLNLKLVQEIEKHPCLYNNTLADYSRKDVTEKVWKKIGEKVNLTGNECKERWKNLRTVFVRHIKPTPNGSASKLKKPYYLADAMQFTLPFIKFLQYSTLNLPVQTEMKRELHDEIEENLLQTNNYEMSVTISSPRSMSLQSISPRASLPASSPPPSPQHLPSPQPTISKESCYCQTTNKFIQKDGEKSFDECSIPKKTKLEEFNDHQKEANKMFLLSLLPDMNEMSPSQIRKFKKKVMDSINEIFEGTTDC
ncbi:unnamed protein product [Euphydryas editha]|uniref:Transcription factor Adf-1 n=1 Tax=Euphydryas editha TaxID=104508 RepID=A0AAU9UEY2_EUPED|nr:unnamed protein product [Euphydryas editha]